MGLFVRKSESDSLSIPTYSIGTSRTMLIVGLGNPGAEYAATRHNIGFMCLEAFALANEFPNWILKKDLKCMMTSHVIGDTKVILIKPTTFMNNSGEAVQACLQFFKLNLRDVLIVHDELDIPFGQIRTRQGGSSAGHNGVKSVIEHLGADFGRIRIGIKNQQTETVPSAAFVLAKFDTSEREQLSQLTKESNVLLTESIYSKSMAAETRSFLT